MASDVDTGKILKLIETDDIYKVPFEAGQYIIVENGCVYYDATSGTSLSDRKTLIPKHEIDIYKRIENKNDEYYLKLHSNPLNGDIVIIKDSIPNSTNYSYTVYIYNDNDEDTNPDNWCKLTSTYNAKNIYFDNDIHVTIPIDSLENKTISAAGKNLEDVMNSIFSPDLHPKIISPSINLSFPMGIPYEIGSTITPTYSMTLNPGSYEYGPETGVVATHYTAAASNGTIKETQSGKFSKITVDESTDFYMSASINYSDGNIPLTKKGNNYADGMIKEGFISVESSHVTGYVNGLFYGCVDENVVNDINSDIIRSLNKSGKAYESGTFNMTVPVGTKSIIIACPITHNGVSKIYNNTVNCDMTAAFGSPITVSVNGNNTANEYARDFNVWIYTPAEAYIIPADLTITLA